MRYNKSESSISNERLEITESHHLPFDFQIYNNAQYSRNEVFNSNNLFDESLKTDSKLSHTHRWGPHPFNKPTFDLDGDRVLNDNNTFVNKKPEFIWRASPLKWQAWSFQETITVGQYEEAHLLPDQTVRTFTATRMILDQSLTGTWTDLPLNSVSR